MPIVINEFEIQVEEPAPSQARGGGEAEQQPSQAKVGPEEVTSVMRVNRERLERVRAD